MDASVLAAEMGENGLRYEAIQMDYKIDWRKIQQYLGGPEVGEGEMAWMTRVWNDCQWAFPRIKSVKLADLGAGDAVLVLLVPDGEP